MRRLALFGVIAALGTGLLSHNALALHNFNLKQQGELPKDQYLDLMDPGHFHLDRLVVKFSEDTRVRLRGERLVSLEGRDLGLLESFLKAHPEIKVERLITSMKEDELDAYVARGEELSGCDVADLNNYYLFNVTELGTDPKGLLRDLLKFDLVQTGYYEPIAKPATCGVDPAPVTPTFMTSQGYRDPAPLGVGINYAWSFLSDYGKGRSTSWFQDLEFGWCEAHEDFAAFTIRNPPDSNLGALIAHGTAVASIVGACDDGKGVTGLVPNVQLSGRVANSYASFADAIAATGADLVTGEVYLIAMHDQGPSQGTACICNCEEFQYLALEYWQANFDAILANSANGRICVEAAGNGSMDLDWAGYAGAFNLGVRDSQAILVGAANGGDREPECWTDHGTRISAYAWGDNVVAAGYGDAFNPAGCTQDYTVAFSGTSAAAPIVAGAAISLASIHHAVYGVNSGPANLRALLQIHGTPQGPADPSKQIGLMPDMKGILAPDLAPYTPSGWAAAIVPSDVTDTHTLPLALPPAPATTYLDFAWVNWSWYANLAVSSAEIFRDDAHLCLGTTTVGHGPHSYVNADDFPTSFRGGLHYLRMECDPANAIDENVESNNSIVLPYRWEPTVLASDAPQTFTRGPKPTPQGYSTNALDGYGNGGNPGGMWDVTGVMPSGGADYDICLYNTAPTPTSGWSSPVATSGGAGTVDFVGCNNNVIGDGDFVGVINYSDSADNYAVERQGSTYLGAVPDPPVHAGDFDLAAGEILDVYEINATAGQPVWFDVDVTAGTADLAVFVFGPSSTYFSRGSAVWTLNNGGAGVDESGVFTPSQSGYHGVVVCKNLSTDLANHANYRLYWGTPVRDLVHWPMPGWSSALVANNFGGTTGQLPAVLHEGASLCDYSFTNIGAGLMNAGPYSAHMGTYLDGLFIHDSGVFVGSDPGPWSLSSGLGVVKGGRHEVGSRLDYLNTQPEQPPDGDVNNDLFIQYVWAPSYLFEGIPMLRSAAPNWANFNNPSYWTHASYNQDGYTFSTNFYWSGVAAIPTDASMQYLMQGYDYASTNPLTGLIGPVVFEYNAPGKINLIMANGNVPGIGDYDIGVMNSLAYPGTPSLGQYVVQRSGLRTVLIVGTSQEDALVGGIPCDILACYDIMLTAGVTYPLTLFNNSDVDLDVSVFSAGQDFVSRVNALITYNATGASMDEAGSFTPTTTGWHGVAVYRSGSSDLGPDAHFSIKIGAMEPARPLIVSITPVDFSPGHATVHVAITPVTQDVDGHPLTVDHYNIYYDDDPNLGTPSVEATTATDFYLQFGNAGLTQRAFLRVTAVGPGGVLLADSDQTRPLPVAVPVPSTSIIRRATLPVEGSAN